MTKRRAEMTPAERDRACEIRRASYQRNKEKAIAYATAYRAENLEKCREHDRGRYARNKEYFTEYNARNKDRIAERRAKWTEANKERISAMNAEWTRNNPEKHRVHQQNRRAKKKANGGTLSPDIAKRLHQLQRGLCACCKQPLGDNYHIDHIVPLALGGENSDQNVQLLRAACNLSKGAKHPVDFMQSRGMLL